MDLQLEVNAKFCGSCKCIKYDAIEISLVWEKILGKVIVDIIVGKGCCIKDHWILIIALGRLFKIFCVAPSSKSYFCLNLIPFTQRILPNTLNPILLHRNLQSPLTSSRAGGSSHKLVRPGSGHGFRQFVGVANANSWLLSSNIYFHSEKLLYFLVHNNNCLFCLQ